MTTWDLVVSPQNLAVNFGLDAGFGVMQGMALLVI